MINLLSEDLARAHVHEHLERAQLERRARRLVVARRLARKAERATARARLALARVI